MKKHMKHSQKVFLQIDSESGTKIVSLDSQDAEHIRSLMVENDDGEFPEDVLSLLDQAQEVEIIGVVNTSGDGWGWYNAST